VSAVHISPKGVEQILDERDCGCCDGRGISCITGSPHGHEHAFVGGFAGWPAVLHNRATRPEVRLRWSVERLVEQGSGEREEDGGTEVARSPLVGTALGRSAHDDHGASKTSS